MSTHIEINLLMKKYLLICFIILIVLKVAKSQTCLPQGIVFINQAGIDNFQTNYPNCNQIEGYVVIGSDDITNLNGLNVVTSIGGYLQFGLGNYSNPLLINLIGLENLENIGGDLRINNTSLISLTGLNNLSSVNGKLIVINNTLLFDLSGLNNLASVGSAFTIGNNESLVELMSTTNLTNIGGNFEIGDNSLLNNMTSIGNIDEISGNVEIAGNSSLLDLSGLNNITSIGGRLRIESNSSLSSLFGLNKIESIGNRVNIVNNDSLTSISAFENLTSIAGSLRIYDNASLINLTGLDNLLTINDLEIVGNINLISLTGLENLNSVFGRLWIESNYSMTSLTSLYNLNEVDYQLAITGDSSLTSLDGLDNIAASSIYDLYIFNNSSLSVCEVQSVCDFLASPDGSIVIFNNADGCNDSAEIAEACQIIGFSDLVHESELKIYPHPAINKLFIANKQNELFDIVIFNQFSQIVLSYSNVTNTIDISTLKPGIYIIEITSNYWKINKKLVVK